MCKAIETMKHNWEQYEREYNDANGENSYAEKFILPPVYDSTTEDEDIDDNEEDITDKLEEDIMT